MENKVGLFVKVIVSCYPCRVLTAGLPQSNLLRIREGMFSPAKRAADVRRTRQLAGNHIDGAPAAHGVSARQGRRRRAQCTDETGPHRAVVRSANGMKRFEAPQHVRIVGGPKVGSASAVQRRHGSGCILAPVQLKRGKRAALKSLRTIRAHGLPPAAGTGLHLFRVLLGLTDTAPGRQTLRLAPRSRGRRGMVQ